MKLTRSSIAQYLIDNPTDKAVQQVAAYLISSGRTKEAELVIREVENLLSGKGRIVARVASTEKLAVDLQKQIVVMLKQQTNAQSVEIINNIYPSLLGGVVIRTPTREVDLTVRNRLNRLKRV